MYHFLLLCIFISASNGQEGKMLVMDPGCLQTQNANLEKLNENLKKCQEDEKTDLPPANLEMKVTRFCKFLKADMNCYETGYNHVKVCLKDPKNEKYYKNKVRTFNTAYIHRCEKAKQDFVGFISDKGQKCMQKSNDSLNNCNSNIKFDEPWVDLLSIDFPPESDREPTKAETLKECRSKCLWLMCNLHALEKCSDKGAANYYRGYYGAMLAASECRQIIKKECPTIAYQGPIPQSKSAINTFNIYCFFISLILSFLHFL